MGNDKQSQKNRRKYIYMKKFNDRLPFCLQLFADETSGENEGTETKDTQSTEGQGNQEKDKSSEKKYSDKDLDAILDKRFARWKADQEKEKKEAERLAEMNAQERAEAERDKVQKELDELKAKNAIAEMTNEARKMCAEHDINVGDDLLSVLVNKDADKTKLYDAVMGSTKEYIYTDVNAEELKGLSDYTCEEQMNMVPGEMEAGEEHDEFYPNESELYEIVLKLFYKSIDK